MVKNTVTGVTPEDGAVPPPLVDRALGNRQIEPPKGGIATLFHKAWAFISFFPRMRSMQRMNAHAGGGVGPDAAGG
jgi:hypothetical protein